MKIKTEKLTGPALDWAVAQCEFDAPCIHGGVVHAARDYMPWNPHSDWSQGGPIKTNNRISTQQKHDGWWLACIYDCNDEMTHIQLSHKELEAAMRCYVASKLGEEVEVPDELLR